ncbi:hypothetical protein M406DRAFT_105487 [Cryphonectria parasitica EP155]|uniref:Uncharacterized protein n=1 Tax=Cryphonectria parasitica (strain ATCC 38755 / EP155) TaxID=660469 RepID=A0A9P4YDN8_CRYP1|nr:uncharacterized protein M406DRAFT_105487 [Cryphonectria parasitica EP155]KAF3770715.1 hypothetical protein M406DRAFT_105487 [Cryphonectria parasitica EP155]
MPHAVVTGCNSGIGHEFAKVLIKALDVTSPESIASFKKAYGDGPLDILLNVAGVFDAAHDSLATLNLASLQQVYNVNTFGPLLLTQALLPNILASSSPRLGFVSSRVGSIADNSSGGSYAYRSSKTALNMLCKNLSLDLKDKGVVVSILHPGIVRTNIGGGGLAGDPEAIEPDEAAEKLFKVMMEKSIEDTGKFWHREGMELPW